MVLYLNLFVQVFQISDFSSIFSLNRLFFHILTTTSTFYYNGKRTVGFKTIISIRISHPPSFHVVLSPVYQLRCTVFSKGKGVSSADYSWYITSGTFKLYINLKLATSLLLSFITFHQLKKCSLAFRHNNSKILQNLCYSRCRTKPLSYLFIF